MNILGIWDGHDSGAAVLVDGRLVAAVNEERLSRRKLEMRFPSAAIDACLKLAGLAPRHIHVVAASTTDVAKTIGRLAPFTKDAYYEVRRRQSAPGVLSALRRQAKYRVTEWPPNALSRRLSQVLLRRQLKGLGFGDATLRLFDHHYCHAIGAALASHFDRATVVTLDGVGDGLSSTVSRFAAGRLERLAATPARHSLGVFFEHVTNLLNMRELEDEGKVMALADYSPPMTDRENELMPLVRVDGLELRTAVAGHALRRHLRQVQWHYPNEQFAHMAQRVVESAATTLVRAAVRETNVARVVLAGGVTSNIKASRLIRALPEVEDVYVFPHMGDGGLAVGAAAAAAVESGEPVALDLSDLGLGPRFSDEDIQHAARAQGIGSNGRRVSSSVWPICCRTTRLCSGSRAGWSTAPARSATAASSRGPIVQR